MKKKCKKCQCSIYRGLDTVPRRTGNKFTIQKTCECVRCGYVWDYGVKLRREKNTYVYLTIDSENISLHRYVYEHYHNTKLKFFEDIHHINLHKGDNRPCNLKKLIRSDHNRRFHLTELIDRVKELEAVLWNLKNGKINVKDVDTSGFLVG